MEKSTFTRQELYDLVWSESMLQLFKKLNISEGGLRRICKWMNITTPKVGHWPKMQYGYKVEIEKLPLEFNEKSEVTISEMSSEANIKEHRLSKLSLLQKQIEKKNNRQLVVLTA